MRTLFRSLLNISAKSHQNRSLQFRETPFQSWCIFETQCSQANSSE